MRAFVGNRPGRRSDPRIGRDRPLGVACLRLAPDTVTRMIEIVKHEPAHEDRVGVAIFCGSVWGAILRRRRRVLVRRVTLPSPLYVARETVVLLGQRSCDTKEGHPQALKTACCLCHAPSLGGPPGTLLLASQAPSLWTLTPAAAAKHVFE